jgi:hypothetical protein
MGLPPSLAGAVHVSITLFVCPVLQPEVATFVGADGGILAVVIYNAGLDIGPTHEQLMLDISISYKVACVNWVIVYVVARGVPLVVVL